MATEFKLPEIGEGTAEGEIIKWLVAEGDVVAEDTPLVEVMTDKATVEIPSPRAGTVLSLRAREGEVVAVGAVIMVLGAAGEEVPAGAGDPVDTSAPAQAVASTSPAGSEDAIAAARARARAELDDLEPGAATRPWEMPEPASGRAATSPATRRLARELGIDPAAVKGSGRDGRVLKADLLALGSQGPEPRDRQEAAASREAVRRAVATPPPAKSAEGDERIPFRGLRRRIAERMSQAKQIIPHFTYVEECDMTEIVALRERAKRMGAEHGLRVTFLPFIVRALVEAARKHPIVNSTLDEAAGEIVLRRAYNVGIATATDRGLIVPVVKNADQLSIFALAREIERLAADARAGRSELDDLQGGTITITSTGNIGGVLATPIINHPEVAILGVTAIRKRPVVRNDEIVIREMVNLSLSLDHRIVDGAEGAVFMRDLVAYLEDPKLLLLGNL